MKIKIVENGEYIFAVKEENIFKDKKIFHDLSVLKTSGEKSIDTIPMCSRLGATLRLFRLGEGKPSPAQMLDGDNIRKPTIQEYFLLSALCKQDKVRYNKKKDKATISLNKNK